MKNPQEFVRITASFFLALSILCVIVDLFSFLFLPIMMNNLPGMKNMTDGMGPLYAWQMQHMNYFYGPHLLVSIMGLVASLGALFKKAWSIPLFTLFLSILVVYHIASFGFSFALIGTMPDQITMNGMAFPKGIMMISLGFGSLFNLGIIGLYIWLWISFRKKEIRNLFG
jgi:hypothetical protein